MYIDTQTNRSYHSPTGEAYCFVLSVDKVYLASGERTENLAVHPFPILHRAYMRSHQYPDVAEGVDERVLRHQDSRCRLF